MKLVFKIIFFLALTYVFFWIINFLIFGNSPIIEFPQICDGLNVGYQSCAQYKFDKILHFNFF
jgi:hypothetical protein